MIKGVSLAGKANCCLLNSSFLPVVTCLPWLNDRHLKLLEVLECNTLPIVASIEARLQPAALSDYGAKP
jgi:hypothetical protein